MRKRILARMISVQLLASCFTSPQHINTLTLPSSWYKKNMNDTWLSTRFVSSLRQHTQWKLSPAFGHQARNNSAASLLPERDDALSREGLLAEQVSYNRRLRQREDDRGTESNGTKRREQSEPLGEEPKRPCLFSSRLQRRLRTSDSASSHGYVQDVVVSRPEVLSPRCKVKQKSALRVMRRPRLRGVSEDGHRWSLEPFLRSENHPVFVQPVKDFVMKRWGVFRSGSRRQASILASREGTGTGKRPDYARAASSTSRDSVQLSRRTQIMTMIQASGTSFGHLASDGEASSNAPADGERILASAEASRDPTNHAQTILRTEGAERPYEDADTEDTDTFPSAQLIPCQFLQLPESGQRRNRTSTSGTTVYSSPLITEASPNSEKFGSDESNSSCTSSGVGEPVTLHKGERVSTS